MPEPSVTHGAAIFEDKCAGCHSNEAGGGKVVAYRKIGTDDALSFGVARGTGKLRPPALIRVADAAPYFHDGSVPSLEALFDEGRFQKAYAESPRGKGPVPGHRFGLALGEDDKRALIAYLKTW